MQCLVWLRGQIVFMIRPFNPNLWNHCIVGYKETSCAVQSEINLFNEEIKMHCFANVELKQLDQLLKEMNSENNHWSSDMGWKVWKNIKLVKKPLLTKTHWHAIVKYSLNNVLKKNCVRVQRSFLIQWSGKGFALYQKIWINFFLEIVKQLLGATVTDIKFIQCP